jgi:hypothetical protein
MWWNNMKILGVFMTFVVIVICVIATADSEKCWIYGKVTDSESDDPIQGATVTVYKAGTKDEVRTATTDINGNYNITLSPGTYDIEVRKKGYGKVRSADSIKLTAGSAVKFNALLPPQEYEIDWWTTIKLSIIATVILLAILLPIRYAWDKRQQRKERERFEEEQRRQYRYAYPPYPYQHQYGYPQYEQQLPSPPPYRQPPQPPQRP